MNFGIAKSSSIYETFSPLYKVLKFLGIISFGVDLKTGEVSVKFFDLLWMVVQWLSWTWLIIGNLSLGAREPVEKSGLVLIGWHWILMFQLIASFFIQMVNLLRRKSIGKLLKIMDEVDEMVKTFPKIIN